MVGSGMAGEFGSTPASLSISHDDILNTARCLSKQQHRDPQFERATAGALSPSLAKVRPTASTSAIQPQPFCESMSNKQNEWILSRKHVVAATTAPRTHLHQISPARFFLSRLTDMKQNCNVQIRR
jgi:hypothetical protein